MFLFDTCCKAPMYRNWIGGSSEDKFIKTISRLAAIVAVEEPPVDVYEHDKGTAARPIIGGHRPRVVNEKDDIRISHWWRVSGVGDKFTRRRQVKIRYLMEMAIINTITGIKCHFAWRLNTEEIKMTMPHHMEMNGSLWAWRQTARAADVSP